MLSLVQWAQLYLLKIQRPTLLLREWTAILWQLVAEQVNNNSNLSHRYKGGIIPLRIATILWQAKSVHTIPLKTQVHNRFQITNFWIQMEMYCLGEPKLQLTIILALRIVMDKLQGGSIVLVGMAAKRLMWCVRPLSHTFIVVETQTISPSSSYPHSKIRWVFQFPRFRPNIVKVS